MTVSYEWDLETFDPASGEILDHHHGDHLREVPMPACGGERLVLVRDSDGGRLWAYVDESRMLPRYFSRPEADGQDHETNVAVPQRFHSEIAREMAR